MGIKLAGKKWNDKALRGKENDVGGLFLYELLGATLSGLQSALVKTLHLRTQGIHSQNWGLGKSTDNKLRVFFVLFFSILGVVRGLRSYVTLCPREEDEGTNQCL